MVCTKLAAETKKLIREQLKKCKRAGAQAQPCSNSMRDDGVPWRSPGHRVLQVLFCTDMPSQNAPPLRGVGLVQVRVRFCMPRPQRTLQGDQSVHDDQPPFTA